MWASQLGEQARVNSTDSQGKYRQEQTDIML